MNSIIFDLDNTLVDSDAAYDHALKVIGIDQARFLQSRANVKMTLGQNTQARNRLLYFKEYFELEGQFSSQKIIETLSLYESEVAKHIKNQWSILGRDEFMRQLVKKYSLFILTNENARTQLIKLKAMDPEGLYFKGLVTSEEVGCEKPHIKIYQHLFKKYNLMPESCWMVGDDVQADILPALSLKMRPLQTVEFSRSNQVDQTTYPVIKKLNELCMYL